MSTDLDRHTRLRRELALPHPSGKLVCVACAHRCKLADGARGVCLVRSRSGDALRVPWGYTAGAAVDPIEKKPFYHVVPGARALSFGMLGCDLHCDYCQNWLTSQAVRDPAASTRALPATPQGLVAAALDHGCEVVTSTYNEPLISAEWAADVFAVAREHGLLTTVVSNGHATPEVLDLLAPLLDAYKVDLKSFDRRSYSSLGGRLESVLDSIRGLVARGVWLEVVTLVVPGFNDSDEELTGIAEFLAGVSCDVPWHVTAFHPDYRMADPPATSATTLVRAAEIGRTAGLRYVYAGNLPGLVSELENTTCPMCQALLVSRTGFWVSSRRVSASGGCPRCGTPIPGIWSARRSAERGHASARQAPAPTAPTA